MEVKHEEYQYLDMINDIIKNGVKRDDRTKVGTLSKFGSMMKFSLKDSFPLLTTKKVFWKGVVEELLFFIRGDTNSKHLEEKGVKIWEANTSREFLDNNNFKDKEVGDMGPLYGFQWRHWGAKYIDMNTDYRGQGIDQLKECIRLIREDPNSRRIVISAWNVGDMNDMVLNPCHILIQFYVANNELSCLMYQRSVDCGLGLPFNIASYALLTHIIAHVTGLELGELTVTTGDTHVYLNHIEQLKIQILRTPKPFPKLLIKTEPKDIDLYTYQDFDLIGYDPHPSIKMSMAV
jgi:thymidylate synthase